MKTVSFCVCTRGPAACIRELLALVRPRVDEIVLAVDAAGISTPSPRAPI
jgi:hypothetical protein